MAGQKQVVKQTTRTGISVNLRNSLEILALSQLDLFRRIETVLEENPFIEEVRRGDPEVPLKVSEYARNESGMNYDETGKGQFLESLLAGQPTLQDYLNSQLDVSDIPSDLMPLTRAIVSAVDDQGFVTQTHEEIAIHSKYSRRDIKTALKYIKALDPPGIAAEDIWQSLEWQSEHYFPDDALLPDIILMLRQASVSLEKLNNTARQELARYLHLSEDVITRTLAKLQQLDPYPARNFRKQQQDLVFPEVAYVDNDGQTDVVVREQVLPELRLNTELYEEYHKLTKDKVWEDKYQEAGNLLKSIQYRHDTLTRIAHTLLVKQWEFFQKGPSCVRPLNLADVAEDVDLHVSTVSRVVSRKYCQSKWGIFPLKFFFPPRLKTKDGQNWGVEDLKNSILMLVGTEQRDNPLSDSQITTTLQKKGFDVQRRTVAKYRKLLHIPSANKRKVIKP